MDDDTRHPLFIKAMNEKNDGNFIRAEKLLLEYLQINPSSEHTHLELAYLYQDYLDDPLNAAYHYRKFLKIAPDSSDSEEINTLLEASEKKILDKLSEKYKNTITDKLKELEKEKNIILRQLKILKSENEKLIKNSEAQISLQTKQLTQNQNITANISNHQNLNPPQKKIPELYIVEPGDNLSKISRKIYGSTKHYRAIYQANKDILSSEDSPLIVGQKLKLPEIE